MVRIANTTKIDHNDLFLTYILNILMGILMMSREYRRILLRYLSTSIPLDSIT